MAFQARPYEITYTIVDGNNDVSTHTIKLVRTYLISDVEVFATLYLNAITPLIQGSVRAFSISLPSLEDAALPTTQAFLDSEVQKKGMFIFNMSDGTKGRIELPSLNPAILETNRETIALNNADVLSFAGLVTDQGLDVNVQDSAGRQFIQLIRAYKKHRRSSIG
jgi:hypothetical protein